MSDTRARIVSKFRLDAAALEALTVDFDHWWKNWPRRDKRDDAFLAWVQTRHSRPSTDVLILATANAASALGWVRERIQFIPLPASWLRGERWTDQSAGIEEQLSDPAEIALKLKAATARDAWMAEQRAINDRKQADKLAAMHAERARKARAAGESLALTFTDEPKSIAEFIPGDLHVRRRA